jgi:DNA-binding transcriptional regulator GbsR (MarR family)
MYKHRNEEMKRADLVKPTRMSSTMVYREVENLEMLGLVEKVVPGKSQSPYKLTDYTIETLGTIFQEME